MAAVRVARSHPRRTALLVLALLGALATLLIVNPFASGLPLGAAARGPYTAPPATDTNPAADVFETTITAKAADIVVADNVTAHAETYNGSIPGPTFMLNVGDTVIVHFKNELTEATAIHWHGIELPNEMDGTPLTQNMVQPGGEFLYKFKVSRPGIFWYHPHHHSSTNQVFKGLYGMIVVKDPNEAALIANGTLPSAADTKQIVLSDTTVCKQSPNNDTHTYDDKDDATPAVHLPWVGIGNLPQQADPVPKKICQGTGTGGTAVDADGNTMTSTDYAVGDIPSIQKNSAGRENEGQTVLTNGINVGSRPATQGDPNANPAADSPIAITGAPAAGADLLNVRPGQGLRLQILNASTFRYMRLRLTDKTGALQQLVRVGGEGGLLDMALQEGGKSGTYNTLYTPGEILLPPGSRADVVAAIPAAADGVWTLWTEDFQRLGGGGFTNIPTVPVMHLNVTGAVVNPAFTIVGAPLGGVGGTFLRAATGNPVPTLLPTATQLLPADGFAPAKRGKKAAVLPISLTAQNGVAAQVDGIKGEHDVADYATADHFGPAPPTDGSSRYARLGDQLSLTVHNTTGAHHPFHLHGFSIQPINLVDDGNTFNYAYPHEFRDNIDIPPATTLNFRIKLEDRPKPDGVTPGGGIGRWVFHCHIFFHATLGMLSELVVLPPGLANTNGDERPNVNTDKSAVAVSQGQTATITGTFNDRDAGDAVTLSSSVGTVKDDGGGKYTWSFPTGTASSQYVYITGTDQAGAKVQMPVQLTISNSAPALTLPAAQSVAQGANLSFNVTGVDADAVDPLALTASGLPATLTFKDNGNRTGTASGQVTAVPGIYEPTITVNDGKNAAVNGKVQITVTRPVFKALVAKKEKLGKKGITVGCRFALPSVSNCSGAALRGTKNVGSGHAVPAAGKSSVTITVALDGATRRAVARSVSGVPVSVAMTALRPDATAPFTATRKTRVVPARVKVVTGFDAFTAGSSKLTKRAKKFLASLAGAVGSAKQIICTGHPDVGSNSKTRAKARAGAACAALQAAGLKAKTFSSVGSTRRHNRHVEVTVLR